MGRLPWLPPVWPVIFARVPKWRRKRFVKDRLRVSSKRFASTATRRPSGLGVYDSASCRGGAFAHFFFAVYSLEAKPALRPRYGCTARLRKGKPQQWQTSTSIWTAPRSSLRRTVL